VNGTAQIIAQLVEPSGTPPHSGTQVSFTTTLGSVEPATVETDINGRAVATFRSGATNGTATITAISGGVNATGNNALKIAIGTAAVGRIVLSASPALVPATGGVSTVTAVVQDINGNALPTAPVSFSSTAGSLDVNVATTDQNGVASVRLTTSTTATVTASVGAQGGSTTGGGTGTGTGTGGTGTGSGGSSSGQASATVTINIAGAPTLVIGSPTPNPPISGLPSTFPFTVTAAAANGSAIRDLTVNWGDGAIQDLGAVTTSAVVAHTYRSPGSYTITATLLDSSGNVVTVSSPVIVNPTALSISITPPTTPPGAGLPAPFAIGIGALPAGDTVRNVHVDWGDGSAQDLGAISSNTTVTHVYTASGTYTASATLSDTAGNTQSVSTSVTVVATATPTIVITASVPTGSKRATFTIQVTPPSGVGITSAALNYGDGKVDQLGGLNGTTTVSHTYPSLPPNQDYPVTLTVTDTLGRTTTGSTTVNVP